MWNFLWEMGLVNPTMGWIPGLLTTFVIVTMIWSASALLGPRASISRIRKTGGCGAYKESFKYIFYVIFQEFGMFFILYLMNQVGPGYTFWPVIAAIIFAVFHFPNLFYMFPSAFMWLGFTFHMEVYHNIYTILMMHFLVGEAYYRLVPKIISTYPKPGWEYIKKQKRLTQMIKRII